MILLLAFGQKIPLQWLSVRKNSIHELYFWLHQWLIFHMRFEILTDMSTTITVITSNSLTNRATVSKKKNLIKGLLYVVILTCSFISCSSVILAGGCVAWSPLCNSCIVKSLSSNCVFRCWTISSMPFLFSLISLPRCSNFNLQKGD